MNNVFKQFLILCGKGFLLYSLIWLMTLFRAHADQDFLPPSFPVRIGSGKHENGARMCICTFQGKKVSHLGTLFLFLTSVFSPSILLQVLELVTALQQHARRIPLLRMASFLILVFLRWIFLIGLQPNLKVAQRVLYIARQSLLLRTEVLLSVIKVFQSVEIADSSD